MQGRAPCVTLGHGRNDLDVCRLLQQRTAKLGGDLTQGCLDRCPSRLKERPSHLVQIGDVSLSKFENGQSAAHIVQAHHVNGTLDWIDRSDSADDPRSDRVVLTDKTSFRLPLDRIWQLHC